MVGFGKIAQDIVQYQLFRAGMADAEADAAVVLAAMRVDGPDAIMPAGAAAGFDAQLAGEEVAIARLPSAKDKLLFISPFAIYKAAYPAAPTLNIHPLFIQYQCTCPPDVEI